MTKYQCPICSKKACDSEKPLSLAKLTSSNENQADVIIKCQCCKSTLAVNVTTDLVVIQHMASSKTTSNKI